MTHSSSSKGLLWTGRIITYLCIAFLLFDSICKVILEKHTVEGSASVGWPHGAIQPTGIVLLLCTILYAIPRTAVFGAILLTGYLGGATALMVHIGQPFLFPVIFGIFVWAGLYLRHPRLRALVPADRQ